MLTTQSITKKITSVLAGVAATALSVSLLAAPAQAADTGLYGNTDPTSDGVFRQSLAILGLTASGLRPAPSAVQWLKDQQCANGAFQSYRADTSTPCAPSDPAAFTGPDTNSTALAAMALQAAGERQAAQRAARALINGAQRTGNTAAWPYNFGGSPDAASTGLVVNALQSVGANTAVTAAGQRWLRARIIPCPRKYGGALRNDATSPAANNFATAQGMLGLTSALPVTKKAAPKANPRCAGNATTRVASYLARTLTNGGILTYSGFGGNDYGSTSAAVVALGSANLGRRGIASAVTALKRDARSWVTTDKGNNVGAAGWLLMVSATTGDNPRSFGGVNLVQTITGSIQ